MVEMVKIEVLKKDELNKIKKGRSKEVKKLKMDSGTTCFLLVKGKIYEWVFSEQNNEKVCVTIFDLSLLKSEEYSYMDIERMYTEVLIDFNKGFMHSVYITSLITEFIWKNYIEEENKIWKGWRK